MQCYSEIIPPSAVSHSVCLPFLHARANNLVVARTSILQIFELKSVSTEVSQDGVNGSGTADQDLADDTVDLELNRMEDTAKLSLICEYPLAGTVLALKRIKLLDTISGGEAILVALKDAKLSLIEWDPQFFKVTTTSVHYYEGESLQLCPFSPDLASCYNFLTVDPSSRCAALKFGQRQLAILPFRQVVDDFADEDFDPDFDDPADKMKVDTQKKNMDTIDAGETPYLSSFVLSLTTLDPSLTHPVHLAFLHGFRDPTFGVLYSSQSTSSALLYERRDILSYTVINLDLEQRASTLILSVTGLPNDLFEVVPLPAPVGGSLLIGTNELLHIDQDGKVNALAVNEFAKVQSKYAMVDAYDLNLRLENCTAHQIGDNGDLLLILSSGDLAVVSFVLEGRSVSGIKVHKVSPERGGLILPNDTSCVSSLSRSRLFLGSQSGDAVILGWSSAQQQPQLTRKRSHADMLGEVEDEDLDELDLEDEDDIYGADESTKQQRRGSAQGAIDTADLTFRIHDRLPNYAPVGPMTLGVPSAPAKRDSSQHIPESSKLEIVYPSGRASAGGLVALSREVDPVILSQPKVPKTTAVWGVRPLYGLTANAEFHEYVVAMQKSDDGEDTSVLYQITAKGLEVCEDKEEFEADAGPTIEVGTLAGGKKILQVLKDQVKVYDANFGLEQIIPSTDETTGVDLDIIGASICDPYLSILRNDSSITVYESGSSELEELERSDGILAKRWMSASLYQPPGTSKPLLFGLTAESGLQIFELPDLTKPVYIAEGFGFLPPVLTVDFLPRRATGRETLTEIIVADIGDAIFKSTYLIVRTKNDDLVLYEPFKYPADASNQSFTSNLRWRKIPQPRLASFSDEPDVEQDTAGREGLLRRLENVGGYSTVFQAGTSPCFILKEASTPPRLIPLRETGVKSLSRLHTADCDYGFIYVDAEGGVKISQLSPGCRYGDTGWMTKKIDLGEEASHVAFYEPKQLYCVASNQKVMFKLPDDDYHHEWAKEGTNFLPTVDQSSIKLYHPRTWSLIDVYPLEPAEVVLTMNIIELEVSEVTRERKSMLCVGTAIIHGEDLPTKGNVYVFEINTVVPEPDRPETGSKIKLIVKEEVRGAVTALTDIGDEGFLMHVQGQKCMVRGLKEDCTLLPVAFMDLQCYMTTAKSLKGTGLALMGDIMNGIWFTGYTQDPYRINLFSKSRQKIQVIDAEFLPNDGRLFILAADGHRNLQILEYDNEHPSSMSGQRLVPKGAIHTGHFPVALHSLPSTRILEPESNGVTNGTGEPNEMEDEEEESPPRMLTHVLVLTESGAVGLVTPIDEQTYRRLNSLHTYLVNQLDHACGLNPRGHRAVDGVAKGVIDGTILRRWAELGSWRMAECTTKMGVDEWTVRSDLEACVEGAGIAYL